VRVGEGKAIFMNTQRAIDILERIKEKEEIACLATNPYSDKFAAGFVERVSEEDVILRSFSTHARYNGWSLFKLDDICRIDHGGRYEEKLLSLYHARQTEHQADLLPALDLNSNLKFELLQASQRKDWAVAIDTGATESICGFVKSVELDYVVIEKFTAYGHADGESTLDFEHIERILVDDEDLQDLRLLTRWHESEPTGW
jgi:hypothetical protein